jgi:hypothetical protein
MTVPRYIVRGFPTWRGGYAPGWYIIDTTVGTEPWERGRFDTQEAAQERADELNEGEA